MKNEPYQPQDFLQLANYYFTQADSVERSKMESVNSPVLFQQYTQWQNYYTALAHRYKAMSLSYRPTAGGKHNNELQSRQQRPILESLKEGGYILYARHAEAIFGKDQPNLNFQDCSTQRNLSGFGRRQAENYGEILRNNEIPIMYPVIASPFCRTRETAELAFGAENVQIEPFLYYIYNLSDMGLEQQNQVLNTLYSFLEIQPPEGKNIVIIDHSFPPNVGFGPITNMGTVIVKPNGVGRGFEFIDKITYTTIRSFNG